ncbi:MAG TPA: biotin--[acetyl-CoA-carboxylase] ligase [Candidatus Binatia bacterium]|nr:biotin--[acetyl-CoA-carboxylase] ligase [Candidatus Binatia bacterium]
MTGPAAYLGVPIEFRRSVASTNDEILRRAAEGAPEGLVIATEEQTAGRGRQGRSWWDAPGRSLLFSVLLRPGIPLPRFPLLGMAMACATAEVGSATTGEPFAVKWPNDVLHGGRKLCGILAESRPGAAGHVLVVGTGINVNQQSGDFPEELRSRATSLRIAGGGRDLDREDLLTAVLERFERYRGIAALDGPEALREAILPWLPQPGSRIAVQTPEGRVEGTVEAILATGALLIQDATGARFPVVAGEIPFGIGDSA